MAQWKPWTDPQLTELSGDADIERAFGAPPGTRALARRWGYYVWIPWEPPRPEMRDFVRSERGIRDDT